MSSPDWVTNPFKGIETPGDAVNLTASALAITIVVVGVCASLFGFFKENWQLASYGSSFTVGFTAAMGMVAARTLLPSKRSKRDSKPYKVVRQSMYYGMDGEGGVEHKHLVDTTIKALQGGTEYFEQRFRWSGDGEQEPPQTTTQGCVLLGPVPRDDCDSYYVHFGRSLAPNEERRFEVVQLFRDDDFTMKPYLCKKVREDMDEIVIEVMFSPARLPADGQVWLLESDIEPPHKTHAFEPVQLSPDKRTARMVRANPVVGRAYTLQWRWPSEA